MPKSQDDKIAIESITTPGTTRVDRAKYMAMREALMKVLPHSAPGLTVAEAKDNLLKHLSDDLFPDGATAGWWLKAVQLDLEAKHVIERGPKSPVRLYKSAKKR